MTNLPTSTALLDLTTPSRLILTDWAADGDSIAASPQALVYQLLLLSLLYDEVLVADEALVLGERLSQWFDSADDFDLFRGCLSLGSIRVLTHPEGAYGLPELAEQAQHQPFSARSSYIERFSTKGESPFRPSVALRKFHLQLDLLAGSNPGITMPIDKARHGDFRDAFARGLHDVLRLPVYQKWIAKAFGSIPPELASTILEAIEEPDKGYRALPAEMRQTPPGYPDFSRSLAYRLSARFPLDGRQAFQRLVQTCFAAPFAASLNGIGRYGPGLRELLWVPEHEANVEEDSEQVFSVEASVDVPVGLPRLERGVFDAIRAVRDSAEGKELRAATRELGSSTGFARQEAAWRSVAERLASTAKCTRGLNVRLAALSVGKELVAGAVVGGLWQTARGSLQDLPASLAETVVAASIGVGGRHLFALLKQDLRRQRLRQVLEGCVHFRCTAIELPATRHVNRSPDDNGQGWPNPGR